VWWSRPLLTGFRSLLPANILDLVARAFAVVQVGGLSGCGAERGRNFERLFYGICDRRGVYLSERAGSRSVAEQRSASGFGHEVDGATRAVRCITHWELKHLTTELSKNELLVFNSKSLDFLQGSGLHFAKTPFLRFLVSGGNVRDVCRYFAVLWGIMLIEPGRLALPLLYEAVARCAAACLSAADCDAVRDRVFWSCRSLQSVVRELSDWTNGTVTRNRCGPSILRYAKEAMDIQEQIGANVLDYLDEHFPEWIDELADETWHEVGGW